MRKHNPDGSIMYNDEADKFLIYDSMTNRPSVKAWATPPCDIYGHWIFEIEPYGGGKHQCSTIIQLADDILSNYFLYGGYAGPYYMNFLCKLVECLNKATDTRTLVTHKDVGLTK